MATHDSFLAKIRFTGENLETLKSGYVLLSIKRGNGLAYTRRPLERFEQGFSGIFCCSGPVRGGRTVAQIIERPIMMRETLKASLFINAKCTSFRVISFRFSHNLLQETTVEIGSCLAKITNTHFFSSILGFLSYFLEYFNGDLAT